MWKGLVIVVLVAWLASQLFLQPRTALTKENLSGKRVVITGASQNIGEEIAYQYCRNGANVFITARREQQLKQVQAKCLELGAQSCGYETLDMGELAQIQPFITKAVQFLGMIRTLNTTAYGATKAALNRFYDNIRFEMLAEGKSEEYSVTLCMLGLIDTKSDYSSQRDLKIKAHPIDETAKAIIEGGLRRERQIFVPYYTKLFYLLQTLLPYQFLDRILLKFVYDVSA